jgi:Cd2+/Zn2+-exporting ATPase/Cu+-exporting ATPase
MLDHDLKPLTGAPAQSDRHSDHHHDDHDHRDHDAHHDHDHGHDHNHAFSLEEGLRIGLVALCALAIQLGLPDNTVLSIDNQLFLPFSWYGYIGLFIGGKPLFKEAFEAIKQRRMTMELSMAIALLAAAYTGYFFVALFITFFVLIAEVLEGMTFERGRRALHELMDLLPNEVTVRRHGATFVMPISALHIGDIVVVAPGARIPVDGPVTAGNSFVDESRITGESMPVEKVAGAHAYAGTVNQSGALDIETERFGRATSFGKIIEAVEQAEKTRAPIQRVADRLASYIVYYALGFTALAYWMTNGDVNTTISTIVVAGACGVAAGTPLAILGGMGRCAKLGAVVKGGVHLETLGKIDTVLLDKTGTLTYGVPDIVGVHAMPGVGEKALLQAAAAAELRSEHPLGRMIVSHARALGVQPEEPADYAYLPGKGIKAQDSGGLLLVGSRAFLEESGLSFLGVPDAIANASVIVARETAILGGILVEDRVRPEAQEAVAALKALKLKTVLLTGDIRAVAERLGRQLGVDEIEAELLPEQKLARVKALREQKKTVAMVGDGVNDAPALVAASVGIAMGSGSEVAREKADVMLVSDNLNQFVEIMRVARRTRNIIWFNFAGTILVDIIGLLMALFGLIDPMWAAIIHTSSELTFILNSARLLPSPMFWKKQEAFLPAPAAARA